MKMPKCPKCGEKIDNLRLYVSGVTESILTGTNIENKVNEEEVEFMPDEEVAEYRCPECDEILFDHQPLEAAKFLQRWITKCKWRGGETKMVGTKECDRCWELHRRTEADLELAKRMITIIEEEQNE